MALEMIPVEPHTKVFAMNFALRLLLQFALYRTRSNMLD